jgi:hypothetical protein
VSSVPSGSGTKGGSGRNWVLIGGVAALLVALAIVVVLVGGDGGSSPGTPGETDREATKSTGDGHKAKPKAKPETLTRSELIAKADAICETSQSTYGSVRSQELEEVPDVAYATTLTGISRRGVERLQRLDAPASVEPAFEQYVRAQERVMRYDRQALQAAEAGDASAYVAARERRDGEQAERYDLAREVGLEQCSASRG